MGFILGISIRNPSDKDISTTLFTNTDSGGVPGITKDYLLKTHLCNRNYCRKFVRVVDGGVEKFTCNSHYKRSEVYVVTSSILESRSHLKY